MDNPYRSTLRSLRMAGYGLSLVLLAAAPLLLSDFRLNLLAKYLTYAMVAIGIDLIWGYTGILSLGQGVFFGLGAYCMAMYLKLEASGKHLPDFMSWSGLDKLPWFWQPFHSLTAAVVLAVAVPALAALILGFFTFRNRIRGVYFTILTQALVLITTTLFIGRQAYTGGTNGITGYTTVAGWSLTDPAVKRGLYYATLLALIVVFAVAKRLVGSRAAHVLIAVRDGENRMRFLGFDPAAYKMFIFSLSAGMAGLAGVFFVLNVGIICPSMMDIVPSIEMVLWVAIGGRGTLVGAVIGALALNAAKTGFSEAYPEIWQIFLGALFVVVVVFVPGGLVGVFKNLYRLTMRRWSRHEPGGSYPELPTSDRGV